MGVVVVVVAQTSEVAQASAVDQASVKDVEVVGVEEAVGCLEDEVGVAVEEGEEEEVVVLKVART